MERINLFDPFDKQSWTWGNVPWVETSKLDPNKQNKQRATCKFETILYDPHNKLQRQLKVEWTVCNSQPKTGWWIVGRGFFLKRIQPKGVMNKKNYLEHHPSY